MEDKTGEKKNQEPAEKFSLSRVIGNLKSEFNKIVWPTGENLKKRSIAVVAVTIFLGVLIGLVDMIIKFGLGFIIA